MHESDKVFHSDLHAIDTAKDIVCAALQRKDAAFNSKEDIMELFYHVFDGVEKLKQKISGINCTKEHFLNPQDAVQDDHIVCLLDGAKVKILTRYIRTKYGMTPKEYRKHFLLPEDYPMSCRNSQKRRKAIVEKVQFWKSSSGRKKRIIPSSLPEK